MQFEPHKAFYCVVPILWKALGKVHKKTCHTHKGARLLLCQSLMVTEFNSFTVLKKLQMYFLYYL